MNADPQPCFWVYNDDRIEGTEKDRQDLQAAMDGLEQWAECCGMELNMEKCKVMHVGLNYAKHEYTMGGIKLVCTEEVKALWVLVNNKL